MESGGVDPLERQVDPDPLKLVESAALIRQPTRPLSEEGEGVSGQKSLAKRFVIDEDHEADRREEMPVILPLRHLRVDLGGGLPERHAEVPQKEGGETTNRARSACRNRTTSGLLSASSSSAHRVAPVRASRARKVTGEPTPTVPSTWTTQGPREATQGGSRSSPSIRHRTRNSVERRETVLWAIGRPQPSSRTGRRVAREGRGQSGGDRRRS